MKILPKSLRISAFLRSALSFALLLTLFTGLTPSLVSPANAVVGRSIGSGGEDFEVDSGSINVLNAGKLSAGKQLRLTGYEDGYTLKVVVTSTNGNVGITTTTGLSSVVGFQTNLTDAAASIAFSGSVSDLNNALDSLKYFSPTSGSSTLTVSVSVISKPGFAYNAANGHYYQYVSTLKTWYEAFLDITGTDYRLFNTGGPVKAGTAGYTLNGVRGYFVTITSSAENDFVYNLLGNKSTWIGASNFAWPNDTCGNGQHPLGQRGYFGWKDPAAPEFNNGDNRIVPNGFGITPLYSNWDAAAGQPDLAPDGSSDNLRCNDAGAAYIAGTDQSGITTKKWDDTVPYGKGTLGVGNQTIYNLTHKGYVVEYGGSSYDGSPEAPLVRTLAVTIKSAQNTFTITNTNRVATILDSVTISTTGGNSSGASISYSVTGDGCSVDVNGVLTADKDSSCSVTATKAGDGAWMPATSAPVIFDFNPVNQTQDLRITNTNLTLNNTTDSITLTATGGSGTGAYSFATNSATCSISGPGQNILKAEGTGNCLVIVTRAPSGKYAVATSQYAIYFYMNLSGSAKQNSDPITLISAGYSATSQVDDTITLSTNFTTSEPEADALMSFSVSPHSTCSFNETTRVLSASLPTACTVYAFWGPTSKYAYRQSEAGTFVFRAKDATPLLIPSTYTPGAGSTLRVTATGGDQSETGGALTTPIIYNVSGTGCTDATLVPTADGKSIDITPKGIAYCNVTASQAAHGKYKFVISQTRTITFGKVSRVGTLAVKTPTSAPQANGSTTLIATFTAPSGAPVDQNPADVSFTVSPTSTCALSGPNRNVLTGTGVTYCTVIARWSDTSIYSFAQSEAKTISFGKLTSSSKLSINAPTSTLKARDQFQLVASYNGSNVSASNVNFTVTPKATCGDYYNPTTQRLIPPGVSACTVIASWSNSSIYEYAQSDPTTLLFGKVTRTGTLAVKDPSPAPKAGDSITLIATYDGVDVTTDSDILFTVTPSDKCLLSGKILRTDVIAYCNVIASWSNSSIYTYAQSASKTISFGIKQSTSPLTITNNDSYNAATSVTLSTSGGNGGTVTYDVYGSNSSTDSRTCANGGPCAKGDIGPGGGIVFYVAPNGSPFAVPGSYGSAAACSPNCNVLEFAPNTWAGGSSDPYIQWDELGVEMIITQNPPSAADIFTGSGALGAGKENTRRMQGVNGWTEGTIPSYGATSGTTGQWFIPSQKELQLILTSGLNLTSFSGFYWSSTDGTETDAFAIDFSQNLLGSLPKSNSAQVRIIRAFSSQVSSTPDCVYNPTDKTLTANKATSCTIIARQAATGNFLSTQSAAKTIKFVRINPADALTLPTLSGVAGTPLSITATGGIPGDTTANLTVSGPAGCGTSTVSGKTITITTSAIVNCTVTATQNPSDLYNFASVSKSYTFVGAEVPLALTIATNLSGTAGKSLRVTATGGDQGATGSTPILYTVTGTGCTGSVSVNSSNGKSVDITPAGLVYCNVIASQAAHGIYKYAKSNVVNIAFNAANADPLVIDNTLVGVAGTPLTVTVTGGNGGMITYSTTGAGCNFGIPTGSRNETRIITTSRLAYCTITAKQSATGIYRPTLLNSKTIAFLVGDAPQELVVANDDADATDTITLASNAPSFGSQVKFKVTGTGCGAGDNKTTITTTGEAWCSVVAYWPAGSVYKYKESAPKIIHFLTYDQASFSINNSAESTSVLKSGSILVKTKGGSGSGLVSFKTSPSDGCTLESVNGTAGTAVLKSAGPAARTCTVTATKAASGKFKSAPSQSVVFTFRAA